MYFQLLRGQYEDANGVRYEAKYTFDAKTGEIIEKEFPVIETDVDLVKSFGTDKFRRLTEEEAKSLMPEKQKVETGPGDVPEPDPTGNFAGRNVTKDFPDAEKLSLVVMFRGRNDYHIYDGADGRDLMPSGSLKKSEVKPFIEKYLEG